MSEQLIVFVKAPRPGEVKTRLATAVGAAQAAALARAMAERVLHDTAPDGNYERTVAYAPAAAGAEIAAWLPGERCRPQSGVDLGARMAAAFDEAFRDGASRVVLVGTDCPGLARADVRAAFDHLRAADVVVGPALDGGYYLIGLRVPAPALFDRLPWSTPAVLGETLARAEALGWRVQPLAVRGDVDTLDDLRREWTRLCAWLPPALVRALEPAVRGGATG